MKSFPGRSRAIAELNQDERAWEAWLRRGGAARLEALRRSFGDGSAPRTEPATPVCPPIAGDVPSVALVDVHDPMPVEVVAEVNEAGATSIRPLSDADDDVRILEDDPRQLWLDDGWAAFRDIAYRDTGEFADPVKRRETERRKRELRALSVEIADNLEVEGVATCYRQDEFVIWMQGVHSGIIEEPVRFAHIMMLPYVAAQKRQRYLQAADYFIQTHPMTRTAVFTTGPRTPLPEVGQRVRELNRALSKLNHTIRREFGIEIVLRSVELGGVEIDESGGTVEAAGEIERDADGVPLFHVHAHTLLHLVNGRPMSIERWRDEFLPFVAKAWGWWWKDLGVIRNAAETVKYITKPREVTKLTTREQAELYRQLHRVHLIQAMGVLREQMRSRKDRFMRLDRAPAANGEGRIWREVRDWNRWKRQKARDAVEAAITAVCAHQGDPYRVRDEARPCVGERHDGEPTVEVEVETRCVAILPPCFMPGSLVREPVAVFWGRRVDRLASLKDPRCLKIREWTGGRLARVALSSTHAHQLSVEIPRQMAFCGLDPPDG